MNNKTLISAIDLLEKVSQDISKSIDINQVLPNIINNIKLYLNCEQVFICYFNPEGEQEIITDESSNYDHQNFAKIIKEYLSEQDTVIEFHKEERRSEDDEITESREEENEEENTAPIIKSELKQPIILKSPEIISLGFQAFWGLLFAYDYDKARVWEDHEIKTIKQVIEPIVIGIERNLIYELLQVSQQRLSENQIIDNLTQLPNYQSFIDCLEFEWNRLTREKKKLSLIMIAINLSDNQKQELILPKIAEYLLEVVKRPCDLSARYSETQFTIILPETDNKGATFLANKIFNLIEENLSDFGYISLNFSVITCIPKPHSEYNLFLDTAQNHLDEGIKENIKINVTEMKIS